jgi:hypothetical protein
MRLKLFIEFCITISIICILAGDLFLPQPYRSSSQKVRTSINQFLIGLLPRQELMDFYPQGNRPNLYVNNNYLFID